MFYPSGLPVQAVVHLVVSENAGRSSLVPSHSCNASTGTEPPEFEFAQTLHRVVLVARFVRVASRVQRVIKFCTQRKFRVKPAANKAFQGTPSAPLNAALAASAHHL